MSEYYRLTPDDAIKTCEKFNLKLKRMSYFQESLGEYSVCALTVYAIHQLQDLAAVKNYVVNRKDSFLYKLLAKPLNVPPNYLNGLENGFEIFGNQEPTPEELKAVWGSSAEDYHNGLKDGQALRALVTAS